MDVMSLRRGLMMGMTAKSAELLHGEFTPDIDLTEYTIDVGKDITFLIVELKTAVLQRGVRNLEFLIARFESDAVVDVYGATSNTSGSSWGTVGIWSATEAVRLNSFVKSGNLYTVRTSYAANNLKFLANTTYEWYAI